jgi:hypothetical protein
MLQSGRLPIPRPSGETLFLSAKNVSCLHAVHFSSNSVFFCMSFEERRSHIFSELLQILRFFKESLTNNKMKHCKYLSPPDSVILIPKSDQAKDTLEDWSFWSPLTISLENDG